MTGPAIRLMKTWPLRPSPVWIDVYFYFIVFSIWRADSFTFTRFMLAFTQPSVYLNWILLVPFDDDDMNMSSFIRKPLLLLLQFYIWRRVRAHFHSSFISPFRRFALATDRRIFKSFMQSASSQCGQIKHDYVENCLRRCETNTSDGLLGLRAVLLLLLLLPSLAGCCFILFHLYYGMRHKRGRFSCILRHAIDTEMLWMWQIAVEPGTVNKLMHLRPIDVFTILILC